MPAKINPDLARGEQCRRSLFKFVQEFWSEIIPEDPVWNWHIEYLCDELQRDLLRLCKLPEQLVGGFILPSKSRQEKLHDLLVNIPPGTSKSTIFTVMGPAWIWSVDPTIRIISASYSGDLAIDHAVKSRDIIQSDKYKRYFPGIDIRADHNNKSNYKNTLGGERYATSTGGTITGIHAHWICCDDLINAKQAASESELEAASNFTDITLSTRKVDKAVTLTTMVMQRLNEKDPAGNWLHKRDMEGKKVKHICLPATISKKLHPAELSSRYINGLLDPVRMAEDTLRQMKIDLGSYGYAGQMDQDPAPEGGGIWQKWFIPVPDRDMPTEAEMTGYGTDVDSAYTDKKANAASAFVVSGMFNNRMYIDRAGWYWKMFPDLIKLMKYDYPEPHYVEAKASGLDLINMLKSEGIAAVGVNVASDKLSRARMATPKAEAGLILVRASILEKIYHDTEQGILKFPNGAKQDLADTIAQAILRHLGKIKREVKLGW